MRRKRLTTQAGLFEEPACDVSAPQTGMDAAFDRVIRQTLREIYAPPPAGEPAPCVVCKRHWLAGAGRTCYWCARKASAAS